MPHLIQSHRYIEHKCRHCHSSHSNPRKLSHRRRCDARKTRMVLLYLLFLLLRLPVQCAHKFRRRIDSSIDCRADWNPTCGYIHRHQGGTSKWHCQNRSHCPRSIPVAAIAFRQMSKGSGQCHWQSSHFARAEWAPGVIANDWKQATWDGVSVSKRRRFVAIYLWTISAFINAPGLPRSRKHCRYLYSVSHPYQSKLPRREREISEGEGVLLLLVAEVTE